jgi:glycosyltransferase involved in cell wall biosynthesis
VDGLPGLVRRVPGVRVVVAGEGPLRGELVAQAQGLGVASALVLAGQVNDLPGWFHDVEVVAMPSTAEGLGTSVLDAMAAARPIVASRAGGLPEIVRDGVEGLLVPPGDAPALEEALARLLGQEPLRQRMGAAASRRVDEAFHVDRMVEETIDVYRACLAERRPAPTSASA